jgi:hypothetical protein
MRAGKLEQTVMRPGAIEKGYYVKRGKSRIFLPFSKLHLKQIIR